MLAADTMLGPYRIVAAIGAGGMGEVYRAVDTRLSREVAVKVLSGHLYNDSDALRRFEQEAIAAGQLNHPNILAIYDLGNDGDRRYIVSELLEGESLRARIRQGPIPARRATDYAVQIARGLAAAHERGIIHRDLKPENVFITRDGIVKILDFGLVKLMGARIPGGQQVDEHAPTLPNTPTEPGRILGTVGYMAPEQIRGGSGDHRSDVFAFGAMLFEMLAGVPVFRGESPIERLNAILKDEPAEFYDLSVRVPPTLERIVRHCLEKNPDDRFQSARDLAFDLGALSGLTSQAISYARLPRLRTRDLVRIGLVLLVASILIGAGWVVGRHFGRRPPPTLRRLTFRSGTITNARFAPDGETVFYGARWAGNPASIFSARPDSPESRDLGFASGDILSVSSAGQLAVALRRRPIGYLRDAGVLAQVPIAGGEPREILEDVEAADWSPDGKTLAIVRTVDGRSRLEHPIGKVLYETVGWISSPRFSPSGETVAFVDHPFLNDDRGSIALVPATGGRKEVLAHEWQSVNGLAWWPDGKELWFAADAGGPGRVLNAVTLRGKDRVVMTSAGWLWLQDIARDGDVLVTQQNIRAGYVVTRPDDLRPRDLSWLDYSVARDLSADGSTVLFSESGEAGGSIFGIYLRRSDGSPAVRLGEGTTEALSPDGRWVLSIDRNKKPAQIVVLPTGVGQPRLLTHDAINHRNARWFPDGRSVLFQGNENGQSARLWAQPVEGGPPHPITPEGVSGSLITPDGSRALGRTAERKFFLYPVDGHGAPQPVPALQGGDVPVRFTPDAKAVFVSSFGKVPAVLTRVDLVSGARIPWKEAMPVDPAGLINVGPILVTPDGKTTVYSYTRLLSDLYLVQQPR
jgi:Tol biopolymer transport system component